ncbi:hypothetical protein [uncultured Lacinutrix sp.]|uniref:hypothetical protein n=1 Tax=uncultured Lacinutrix sp. TaxID=574032 RepID=UPI0026222A6F|nr:hypothetical protein [uncultured Lacinutrix sp.]
MNNELRIMNFEIKQSKVTILFVFFALLSLFSFSQVKSSIDVDSIKIGEQITYKVEVEADTSALVIFPEGQTFGALEMIESYTIDTTRKDAKYNLVKKYGLTKFDSGVYSIPKQKILIDAKELYTDSLKVEVREIVVDTTKQGLYDIKPIIEVNKSVGNWWKYLLITLLAIALVAFLLWWFIWRQKPLTEEEEIALLPPYDRAKLALQKLDESGYLQNENLKDYYSDLTFIIRKYLDEKVYDRALESTTDQLVSRLNLLKDGNQIELSKEDIRNIETILKRADLVKFAKGTPDIALAEIDRNTIALEIDHVKEALPEPTEEEKLLDLQYKEEQERKKKRKKIILTAGIVGLLLIATFAGFAYKYGFNYVKDTITGKESKQLLERKWVTSEYGFPPVTISTPEVLKRVVRPDSTTQNTKVKASGFNYGGIDDILSVTLSTVMLQKQVREAQTQEQADAPEIDLAEIGEAIVRSLESKGVKDIVILNDKFTTPNGAEGLRLYGTLSLPTAGSESLRAGKFNVLLFTVENILQQIIITSEDNDVYLEDLVKRILDSIELKPKAK